MVQSRKDLDVAAVVLSRLFLDTDIIHQDLPFVPKRFFEIGVGSSGRVFRQLDNPPTCGNRLNLVKAKTCIMILKDLKDTFESGSLDEKFFVVVRSFGEGSHQTPSRVV